MNHFTSRAAPPIMGISKNVSRGSDGYSMRNLFAQASTVKRDL
jgi:hypothetical protein